MRKQCHISKEAQQAIWETELWEATNERRRALRELKDLLREAFKDSTPYLLGIWLIFAWIGVLNVLLGLGILE